MTDRSRRLRIVDAEAADAAADLLVAVSAPGSRAAATISRGLKLPPDGEALDAPEPTWKDMQPGYEVVIARQSSRIAELQAERDLLLDDVARCRELRLKDAMEGAAEVERLRVVLRGENEAVLDAVLDAEYAPAGDDPVVNHNRIGIRKLLRSYIRAAGRACGVVEESGPPRSPRRRS